LRRRTQIPDRWRPTIAKVAKSWGVPGVQCSASLGKTHPQRSEGGATRLELSFHGYRTSLPSGRGKHCQRRHRHDRGAQTRAGSCVCWWPAQRRDDVHWVHSLMIQSEGSQLSSLFRYKCACGSVDVLYFDRTRARCGICGISYPRGSGGAIMFDVAETEQNAYFDKLYKSGRFHVKDAGREAARQTYLSSAELAQRYLERGIRTWPIQH
jgi:hypothetical protein